MVNNTPGLLCYQDDEEKYRMMCELSSAKRRADRMEVKLRKLKQLVEKAEKEKAEALQVKYCILHSIKKFF